MTKLAPLHKSAHLVKLVLSLPGPRLGGFFASGALYIRPKRLGTCRTEIGPVDPQYPGHELAGVPLRGSVAQLTLFAPSPQAAILAHVFTSKMEQVVQAELAERELVA